MPTMYPKCSPTEMMGLLLVLKNHGGAEDVARLSLEGDLEIDEILPATEFAEALGLIRMSEGRASLSESGTRLLAASIRERKAILRDQLKRTTLFRTLVQAMESKPDRRLSEDELNALVEFTTAPADEFVQNIINWGRYAELFRYDADARILTPPRSRPAGRLPPGGGGSPPEEARTDPGVRSPRTPPPKTSRPEPPVVAPIASAA